MLYFWRNSIKHGDLSLWRKGAIGATYLFASEYLFSKGCKSMYVGLSRAFLNDGTLRYKKKWGMKLRVFRKYTYALRMLRDTLPSRSFFQHNPFFCLSGGALYEAFFLHGKGMPDQVASTYRFEGISGLRYYDVRDFSLLKKE